MAKTDPEIEIQAMTNVAKALADVDDDARGRVLRWAVDHFQVPVGFSAVLGAPRAGGQGTTAAGEATSDLELAEVFAGADPKTDAEKALVAGYWLQFVRGAQDLDSQSVNSELKHLGHGVRNITSAFGSLMEKKPQLVMQTRKSGKSRQARKKYKLTAAGKAAVETMLAGEDDS